jgi:spermidine/putrescine-binding protein
MYTDQVTKAKIENPRLEVVFPKEGIGFGIMASFIPSRAPNAAAAHAFLNFILDARRGAQCFEYLGYYCTFKASEQYIDPRYKEFLIMPTRSSGSQRTGVGSGNINFGNMEMMLNISQEAEDAHARIWSDFISTVGR